MKKNKYILAGCVLFLLIFAVFFLKSVSNSQTSKIPYNMREAIEVIAEWEKIPFEPIQDEVKLNEYLKSLPIHDEEGLLSMEQREALLERFKTLLYAYSKGTWEDFMKFRFPEGAPYVKVEETWEEITAYWFKDHPEATRKDLPEDEQLYRWWIEKDQPGEGIYKDYWQGIALSDEVNNTLKNQLPEKFKKAKLGIYISEMKEWSSTSLLFGSHNVGVAVFNKSFEIPFWEPYIEQDKIKEYLEMKLLTAEIFFFAKPADNANIIPIYAKFIWDKDFSGWLVTDLSRGDLLPLYQGKYFKKKSHFLKF